MKSQTMLVQISVTEGVCETCRYFSELDEAFYCKFFEAFLAEETLCLPCDFKEDNIKV